MPYTEPKTLKEFLEREGNPKHSITATGETYDLLVIEDKKGPGNQAVTIWPFYETTNSLSLGTGQGIRKEWLRAIKDYLDKHPLE
jgi:hypothetical protein